MMACMTAAVLALGMSTMALAAEPAANTITVNGQGIVKVAPNVATIHATVEKTAKTAAQAQKAVNEELTDVIAAMKALGITDEDIVTSHISVYPSYRYDEKTDKQVLENYQAYTSVNVTTNDVDNAGKYVDAALNAGATGTNGFGICVAPNIPILQSLNVKILPLVSPSWQRNFYMAMLKNVYHPPVVEAFKKYVIEQAQKKWDYKTS